MTSLQQIRTLTIQAREEGIAQVRARMDELAASQQKVFETSDRSARQQASAVNAFKRAENALDAEARAARNLVTQIEALDRARVQGLGGDEVRQNQLRTAAYQEYTVAVQRAQKQEQLRSSAANDFLNPGAVKQIGYARHELQNLGQQAMDVGVMLQGGMSPLTTLVTQGPQIFSVMAGSQTSIREGLKGIAMAAVGMVTPITAGTVALVAGGAALAYYVVQGQNKIRPLNEALEEHKTIIAGIAAEYGLAMKGGDAYASSQVMRLRARQTRNEVELGARSSLLDSGLVGSPYIQSGRDDEGNDTSRAFDAYKAFEKPLLTLREGLKAGKGDAKAFVDEVARIANQDPSNDALREMANDIIKLAKDAADAQGQLDSYSDAVKRAREAAISTQLSTATENLRGMLPDNRTERDLARQAYEDNVGRINALPGGEKRNEGDSLREAAARTYSTILTEIDRKEDVIRKGRELDIRSITAKTVAERAAIAAERERLSLSGVAMDPADKKAAETAASNLVFAEDAEREREYLRQTVRGREDAISALRIEAETFGLTRGAAQAYRMEQEQILALYRRAEDTGGIVDQAEIDRIRQAAQATGALTDSIIAMGDAREQQAQLRGLVSEAGLLGASDDQVRLGRVVLQEEERLRRQNIDLTSEQARATIDNAKAMSDYGEQLRRTEESWSDWRRTSEGALDTVADSLINGDISGGLKTLKDDILKFGLDVAVMNPIKNGLLGTSYGTLADMFAKPGVPILSGLGELGTMANPMYVRMDPLGLGGLAGLGGAGGNPLGAAGAIAQNFGLGKQGALGANGLMPVGDVAAYIQKAAIARGIDPGTALRVARSEGLGEGIWQSNFSRNGFREPSFGPFQLLKGGAGTGYGRGMGNDFMRQTGLDPADPKNTYAGIDFALDGAAKNGWGAWFGAGRAGIGNREGLGGARAIGVGGGGDAVSALAASQEALTQASTTIATTAQAFGMSFDTSTSMMLNGMQGTIGEFLPKFGGSLTSLIQSLSGSTGISTGTVGKILGGAVGLFDVGGHTGYGDSRDVAGFVHRNEIVWSQKDIARSGGLAAVEAMRLGGRGYMKGGVVGGYDSPAPLSMPSFDYAADHASVANTSSMVYAPVINAPGADKAGLAAVREELRAQGEQMRKMNKGIESRVDRRQQVATTRGTRA